VRASDSGIEFLQRFEGFVPTIYLDAAGLPTIGYGHLLTEEEQRAQTFAGRALTKTEATELLREDVGKAERAIDALVTVPLKQHQYDALVAFVFNVGKAAFTRSTLRRRLNAGEYGAVPHELMRWNKVRNPKTKQLEPSVGLTRRRQHEADLWNTRSIK
jgi:lysozyme